MTSHLLRGALLLAAFVTTATGWAQTGPDGKWKIAPAPLITRFARDVRPDNPRPEYPRPIFVRKEWKSLNGMWDFAFTDPKDVDSKPAGPRGAYPHKILVPFTFESALSGIGKGTEVHEYVTYRRTFDVPGRWRDPNKKVLMNFGAVDWQATVFVNDKEVGKHRGGYTPFTCDITEALKPGSGPQEVVVQVYDPADPSKEGWQPKGKQLGSEGIWYTRTTGIWQSVWLEPVPLRHLERVETLPGLSADGKSGALRVTAVFDNMIPVWEFEATVSQKGKTLATARLDSKTHGGEASRAILNLSVPGITPWTPETPALYDVKYTLKVNGKVADEATSYAGFRIVGIKNGRLTLNGRPYFYRGVLDQGYWPDGIYTPPTDAAIKFDVETTKKLGFNMSRKHVKVEDPRWYYWCDKLGVAVWQDMPSSHNLSTETARVNFTNEWNQVMNTTTSYPSVVHLIPFNENWGNPGAFQDEIVTLTRKVDFSRPITDASGWTQRQLTDVIDAHDYSNNLIAQGVKNPIKPKVVGEYGGIALPVEGHTWTTGWGYQTVRSGDALVKRVRFQTTQLFEAPNLSGFVYTQLTDVEQEMNGLLTYDRLPKADLTRFAAVFEGKDRAKDEGAVITDWHLLGPIPSGVAITEGANSAESEAQMRQVLDTEQLASEATMAPQNGSVPPNPLPMSWRKVTSQSGMLEFHNIFGKQTDNAVAYAYATIDSAKDAPGALLHLGSDDGAVVYLNGKEIGQVNRIRGLVPDEDTFALPLRAGRNTLLIKVGQGVGGWGLSARVEK